MYYQNNAFFQESDKLIWIFIKSKIMINIKLFWKNNLSYFKLFIKKSNKINLSLWNSSLIS
jgi:hypothetical protein